MIETIKSLTVGLALSLIVCQQAAAERLKAADLVAQFRADIASQSHHEENLPSFTS